MYWKFVLYEIFWDWQLTCTTILPAISAFLIFPNFVKDSIDGGSGPRELVRWSSSMIWKGPRTAPSSPHLYKPRAKTSIWEVDLSIRPGTTKSLELNMQLRVIGHLARSPGHLRAVIAHDTAHFTTPRRVCMRRTKLFLKNEYESRCSRRAIANGCWPGDDGALRWN